MRQVEQTREATRFDCFDGLRAIAALAVFAYHAVWWTHRRAPDTFSPVVFDWFDRLGFFGVAVFFVISGFLLYRPYAVAAFAGQPPPRLGRFWLRRAARIYPAYWLALVFVIVVGLRPVVSVPQVVSWVTLTQTYRAGWGLALGVAWSLVIEVSFYVALPGLAWLLRRLPGMRGQLLGIGVLAAVAIVGRAWWLWAEHPTLTPGAWFPAEWFQLWLPAWLDWFALGMAMAVLHAHRVQVRVPGWVAWAAAFVCYAGVVALDLPPHLNPSTYAPADSFWRWVLTGVAGAWFVVPAVFGSGHGVRGLLVWRPLVLVGVVSYGVYLWHLPLFAWLPLSSMVVHIFVVFAATLAVATVSYRLVERPINRWARRL